MPSTPPTIPHRWKFFRTGGFDQVLIESGADLMALDQLDQKLWVVLSCPVKGLELDEKTLESEELTEELDDVVPQSNGGGGTAPVVSNVMR